jgi:hypothetical protein
MHNSDPTPQGVENRNILLWFKSVLTALHVNCMITELISNGDLFQPHLKYTLTFFNTYTSRSRSFITTQKMNYEKLEFEREIIDVVRSSYI